MLSAVNYEVASVLVRDKEECIKVAHAVKERIHIPIVAATCTPVEEA